MAKKKNSLLNDVGDVSVLGTVAELDRQIVDLTEKIERINKSLGFATPIKFSVPVENVSHTPVAGSLLSDDRYTLQAQVESMMNYRSSLQERVARFKSVYNSITLSDYFEL